SATYDGALAFTLSGQRVQLAFSGGSERQNGYLTMRAAGLPGLGGDMSVIVRDGIAHLGLNGSWQRLPAASLGTSGDAALGPAAFAELTRHVRSVRVTEGTVVAGRRATTVSGRNEPVEIPQPAA
ncbi:MAG TPA: hypothetical protein VNT23_06440, partial [Gaiellaceae bacterium]|nr:hypothetical protein [Gaiellaceae bacterium]